MAQAPAYIYTQISALLSQRPPLEGRGPYRDEQHQWLARSSALVEQVGTSADEMEMKLVISSILSTQTRVQAHSRLMVLLFKLLARAEMALPPEMQGAFVEVGHGFTALQVVGKVLASATRELLIVDPYLNSKALFDFVVTAPDGLSIQLLADSHYPTLNAELKTGVSRWQQQYGGAKPVEARVTAPRALHDRLVIADRQVAWGLSQSLKDFAGRSPASVNRFDVDTAALKSAAYGVLWDNAVAL